MIGNSFLSVHYDGRFLANLAKVPEPPADDLLRFREDIRKACGYVGLTNFTEIMRQWFQMKGPQRYYFWSKTFYHWLRWNPNRAAWYGPPDGGKTADDRRWYEGVFIGEPSQSGNTTNRARKSDPHPPKVLVVDTVDVHSSPQGPRVSDDHLPTLRQVRMKNQPSSHQPTIDTMRVVVIMLEGALLLFMISAGVVLAL